VNTDIDPITPRPTDCGSTILQFSFGGSSLVALCDRELTLIRGFKEQDWPNGLRVAMKTFNIVNGTVVLLVAHVGEAGRKIASEGTTITSRGSGCPPNRSNSF